MPPEPSENHQEPSESAREEKEQDSNLHYLSNKTRQTVSVLMTLPRWDKSEAKTVELVAETNRTFPNLDVLATATSLAFKLRTGAVGPYKKPSKAFVNWASSDAARTAERASESSTGTATPMVAITAIRAHETLKRYASLASRWDFTSDDVPDWKVLNELGGLPEEQHKNLKRVQRVAKRAVQESEAV